MYVSLDFLSLSRPFLTTNLIMRSSCSPPPRNTQPQKNAPLIGLAPVMNSQTQVLILGSFPGQQSLSQQQYYAHPRNQFWPLLSAILNHDLCVLTYSQRLQVVLDYGLGMWDVYATCQRVGSLDSAIRNGIVNPLEQLKQYAPSLQAVAHNGGLSWRSAACVENLGVAVYRLPSSSPAHARLCFAEKLEIWRAVLARHLPIHTNSRG